MTISANALQAINARRNGIWDDPCLLAFGPLSPNTEGDVLAIKREALIAIGATVGPRNPNLNRNFPGHYMVVEAYESNELPTDDGSNGPWCIVGDDEIFLINEAFDILLCDLEV